MLGGPPVFKPHAILHPTDYSDNSAYAFKIAVSLAEQHGAILYVAHVVESLGPELVTVGEATTQLQPQAHVQQLWDELRQVKAPPDSPITVKHILAEGPPAGEVAEIARKHHCDLIVISTHGRTGLERLLMGSIAEKIVRLAPCAILTVKCPPCEPKRTILSPESEP
jgi:nucleotide-binding universal stress UspA family protein